MTRRRTPAALAPVPAPIASGSPVCFAVGDGPLPPRHLEAVGTALGCGLDVEFRCTRGDALPCFRLRSHRGAVHVLGPDFAHLATVASVAWGLALGWERGRCGILGV